jgi:hypothetical protein
MCSKKPDKGSILVRVVWSNRPNSACVCVRVCVCMCVCLSLYRDHKRLYGIGSSDYRG